jgi:hypothetical protein
MVPCPVGWGEFMRTKIHNLVPSTRSSGTKTALIPAIPTRMALLPPQQVCPDNALAILALAKQIFGDFRHALRLEAEFPLELLERG